MPLVLGLSLPFSSDRSRGGMFSENSLSSFTRVTSDASLPTRFSDFYTMLTNLEFEIELYEIIEYLAT